MTFVKYGDRMFELPNGPRVLVLDSEGFLSHFTYYDTRYQSILMDPRKVEALRGDELIPTIQANRFIMTGAHHFNQKPSVLTMDEQIKNDPIIFEYQSSCKAIWSWEFMEPNDNPYMLGIVSF